MTARDLQFIGDDAIRITVSQPEERFQLADFLHRSGNWAEIVVGKRSVTVQFDPLIISSTEVARRLRDVEVSDLGSASVAHGMRTLKIQTNDGNAPDLAECAETNDCSIIEFLERIQRSNLRVDMLGFAPGFAYVDGVDPQLEGTRLEHPRQLVKAGSVGFISGHLGLYALDGPGGWPIIGRTDALLFDESKSDPFLIKPGLGLQIEWI